MENTEERNKINNNKINNSDLLLWLGCCFSPE
jgi:hypothetical protein